MVDAVVRPSRSHALIVLATLLASCAGSRGTREPWVYGLSRSFYEPLAAESRSLPTPRVDGSACELKVVACILVLPLALDTALLVVTVPHDLLFEE